MSLREKVITCLSELKEPSSTAQIYNHIFGSTVEAKERPKLTDKISVVLHNLCVDNYLRHIVVPRKRGYFYCLPKWYSGNKLKEEYQYKLDSKLLGSISVALVDDQILFRKGLKEILLSFGNIKVEIEASNGTTLMEMLAGGSPIPDICILSSPAILSDNNITLIDIKKKFKKVKVLILATYDHEFTIRKMMYDGANGFLTKNCYPIELRKAIHTLYKQKYYWEKVPTSVWESMVNHKRFGLSVTEKQLKFLSLCVAGLRYEDIATEMGISTSTIDGYKDKFCESLGAKSRSDLSLLAIKTGLIDIK